MERDLLLLVRALDSNEIPCEISNDRIVVFNQYASVELCFNNMSEELFAFTNSLNIVDSLVEDYFLNHPEDYDEGYGAVWSETNCFIGTLSGIHTQLYT